jgi:hypothetical protein
MSQVFVTHVFITLVAVVSTRMRCCRSLKGSYVTRREHAHYHYGGHHSLVLPTCGRALSSFAEPLLLLLLLLLRRQL